MHPSKKAAPESIRALNLLPAYTVTVGQSDTNPTVYWFKEFPSHLSLSLLGGRSSLKDQNHCQNLMRSLKENLDGDCLEVVGFMWS